MSFVKVNIHGLEETITKISNMNNTDKVVAPILENSYRRYQFKAFRKAPVLTGRLSSNLVDDRFTFKKYGKGNYRITQRQGTYSYGEHYGAYYLLLQEFTNRSKSRFVRDSLDTEYAPLSKELIDEVMKEMKM